MVIKFAQIGPNVSISADADIGAGVRLINYIILDDVKIKVFSCPTDIVNVTVIITMLYCRFQENVVIHSIVDGNAVLGGGHECRLNEITFRSLERQFLVG